LDGRSEAGTQAHVTLYKPGKIPIPPKFYGCPERVIYRLGKALVTLGERLTLIANAGSHLPGVELRIAASNEKNPQA
jgi:hypothetical protein